MTGDITFNGTQTFAGAQVTGTVSDSGSLGGVAAANYALSANVLALTGGTMTGDITFNGTQTFAASQVSGTMGASVTLALSSLSYTGTMSGSNITGGTFGAVSGTNLTALNATALASGTVADARLTGNVTLQGNTFNGADQLLQLNASGDLPALGGSNLTTLNANSLTTGLLPNGRLAGTYTSALTLNNASNSFTGTFAYSPATPANWAGVAPTNVKDALDRLAARLVVVGGGTPIP